MELEGGNISHRLREIPFSIFRNEALPCRFISVPQPPAEKVQNRGD